MRIFNYEIRKVPKDIKEAFLDKKEQNAKLGLIEAKLELTHHTFLLEQLEQKLAPNEEEKESLEREIRLTKEAIERDRKSINNWETQLRAINHERNT